MLSLIISLSIHEKGNKKQYIVRISRCERVGGVAPWISRFSFNVVPVHAFERADSTVYAIWSHEVANGAD